jgi:hypothetical protein
MQAAQATFFMDCLTPKMKVLFSFETSGTARPITQCHTPEDLNPKLFSVI